MCAILPEVQAVSCKDLRADIGTVLTQLLSSQQELTVLVCVCYAIYNLQALHMQRPESFLPGFFASEAMVSAGFMAVRAFSSVIEGPYCIGE
jgi:hypothetical protein